MGELLFRLGKAGTNGTAHVRDRDIRIFWESGGGLSSGGRGNRSGLVLLDILPQYTPIRTGAFDLRKWNTALESNLFGDWRGKNPITRRKVVFCFSLRLFFGRRLILLRRLWSSFLLLLCLGLRRLFFGRLFCEILDGTKVVTFLCEDGDR